MKKDKTQKNKISIKNRRASFDYEIVEEYTAGIVLVGSEIKSLRQGRAGLVDTFCFFSQGELWVKNLYIAEYFYASYNNHVERRDRKLLLNRKELKRIQSSTNTPGYTVVPLRLFINERGLAKIIIAIARGKKQYDKRASIRDREDKRNMDRALKNR